MSLGRMLFVVGAALVIVVAVVIVGLRSRSPELTNLPGLTSGRHAIVVGKLVRSSAGVSEVLEAGGGPKDPLVTPIVTLATAGGIEVTCAFGEVDREAYRAWVRAAPAGSLVTVAGVYTRSGGDHMLTDCKTNAPGFPPPAPAGKKN